MAWSRASSWLITTVLLLTTAGELSAVEARLVGPAGKCLGTVDAPAGFSPLELAACGEADDVRQRWTLPARGFTGEARLGGLCLDVDHSQTADHTPVQLFPCHGGANQRWQHDTVGRLVGLAGKCLELSPGGGNAEGHSVLFGCGSSSAQSFLAQPYEAWGPTHTQNAMGTARILATSDPAIAYQHDDGNLLRSADGGRTWAEVSFWKDGYSFQLAVEHQQPDRLWRLTDFRKLWRSEDGGRTWRVLAEAGENLSLLTASRVDPRVLVALSETGFWLSRDGGQTFARYGELPPASAGDRRGIAAIAENAAGEWLVADMRDCGSGGAPCDGRIFVTADFGKSWQSTFEYATSDIALASFPADSQILYLLKKDGELARSSDGGHSFTLMSRLPGATFAYFPIDIAVDPANAAKVWVIFKERLFASEDGGAHWLENARPQLADVGLEPLTVNTLGGGTVLAQASITFDTTRQLVISRDGGAHWARETSGVHGGVFHFTAAASPGRYFVAEKHGGLRRTDDRGRLWQELSPRPCVSRLEADPAEPDTVYYVAAPQCSNYSAEVFRGLWRSRDAGLSFEEITPPGVVEERDLEVLLVVRHGNATVLLTGGLGQNPFWRSADGGSTWQQVTIPTTVYQLMADAGKIYATGYGAPCQSADGGASWTPLAGQAPLAVGGGKKVYQTVGKIVVQLASGALVESAEPGGHGYGFGLSPRLDRYGRLYLIGDGIFRSLDDGRTWQNLESGSIGNYGYIFADPFDAELLVAYSPSGPMIGRFADPTPLVLGHGRFKAKLEWRAPDGLEGLGQSKNLTDDSGGFSFFGPERTEVVVKVLDGRTVNGRFWVFVGSLTDVEFELEVVDQISGEKRRYHNDGGRFASFGDTSAFPLGAAQPATDAAAPTFYYPDTTTYVPLSSRFEVDVTWHTADGSGVGKGSRLSEETAAFTFFSPENVELLVNVIDGRTINGRYWVFAGSLSNVAYTLRVRDLATGAVKEYQNPAGKFASFGDTSAF